MHSKGELLRSDKKKSLTFTGKGFFYCVEVGTGFEPV